MTGAGSFAVVIATCDRPDSLLRTLESLQRCRIPDHFSRLVIVENGGRERPELIHALPACLRAEYLRLPVANKSTALNRAMEALHEHFALFFDDDIAMEPRILEDYASAFMRYGGDFFFGGSCIPQFESEPDPRVLRFFPKSIRGLDHGNEERIYEEIRFLGCNWAAPVAAIRAIGGFNPHFGPGGTGPTGQETLAQRALLRRGVHGVYLPQARVHHRVPASHCSIVWLRQRYYRSGIERGWRDKRATAGFTGHFVLRLARAVLGIGRSLWSGDAFARVQWLLLLCHDLRGHRKGRRCRTLLGDCE